MIRLGTMSQTWIKSMEIKKIQWIGWLRGITFLCTIGTVPQTCIKIDKMVG